MSDIHKQNINTTVLENQNLRADLAIKLFEMLQQDFAHNTSQRDRIVNILDRTITCMEKDQEGYFIMRKYGEEGETKD